MKRIATLGLIATCCAGHADTDFHIGFDYTQNRHIEVSELLDRAYDIVITVHGEADGQVDEGSLGDLQLTNFSSQLTINGQLCGQWVTVDRSQDADDSGDSWDFFLATNAPELAWQPAANCSFPADLIERIEEEWLYGDSIDWSDLIDDPMSIFQAYAEAPLALSECDPDHFSIYEMENEHGGDGVFKYARDSIQLKYTDGWAEPTEPSNELFIVDAMFDLDAPVSDTLSMLLLDQLDGVTIDALCYVRAAGRISLHASEPGFGDGMLSLSLERGMTGSDGKHLYEAATHESIVTTFQRR